MAAPLLLNNLSVAKGINYGLIAIFSLGIVFSEQDLLFSVIVFGAAIAGVSWNLMMLSKEVVARDTIAELLGKSPKVVQYVNYRTAIGINRESNLVALRKGDLIKSYPYDRVQSWHPIWLGDGLDTGKGLFSTFANSFVGNLINDYLGFQVRVDDPEHPVWMIYMESKEKQLEWVSTMQIAINGEKDTHVQMPKFMRELNSHIKE
jgi:hypothetical protein